MRNIKYILSFTFLAIFGSLAVNDSSAQQIQFPQSFECGVGFFDKMKLATITNEIKDEIGVQKNPGVVTDSKVIKRLMERRYSPDISRIYFELYQGENPEDEHSDAGILISEFRTSDSLQAVLSRTYDQSNTLHLMLENYLITAWSDFPSGREAILAQLKNHFVGKLAAIPVELQADPSYVTSVDVQIAEPDVARTAPVQENEKAAKRKTSESELEQRAYDAMENKDYDQAIKLYDEVIKANRKNSRAYYNIAWMYASTGRQNKAIEISRSALEAVEEEQGDFYRMIGNCYTEMGDLEQGKENLLKALSYDEDDIMSIYNLGYNRYDAQDFELAISYLKDALNRGYADIESPFDTYFYIGTSLLQLKKYAESLPYFDTAIAGKEFVNYYINKAEALLQLNRYADALSTMNIAVDQNPGNADVFFKRHQVYKAMGNPSLSIKDLKKGHEINPLDPDMLLDMGVWYAANNEIGQALHYYQESLENKGDSSSIYANIGNLYADNIEKKDSADLYYKKAIALDPDEYAHYYNYGNFLRKQNHHSKAILMYEKAIELNPNLSRAYTNLAVVYANIKDYPRANKILLTGLKIAPDDYELNANMAHYKMYEEKNYDEAEAYATKAIQIRPESQDIASLLNLRGLARQMSGKYNDALYDYFEILRAMSKDEQKANSSLYSNIGYAYLGMEEYTTAKKYFIQAMNLKEDADAAIGLATVYYLLNEKSNYEKAKSNAIYLEPLLKQGMKGITQMEKEDYFYTERHKVVLRKMFGE